ncbi:MAG: SDR family NAD(P)-dependent oxidoreductase, partial [Chlamydiales bacterium]|nr:SDR family NAD(P)-dependent oxidoreductase [Chlamydiales bacterium]
MNKIILWFLPLIFSTKLLLGASPSENKKVILIIDSFQGMGKDIAQALEKSDQYIIYVATQHSNESFLMQNIGIRNDNLYFKSVDITKENEAQRLIHEILQREKRIDILINNIGKGLFGCAETVKIEK